MKVIIPFEISVTIGGIVKAFRGQEMGWVSKQRAEPFPRLSPERSKIAKYDTGKSSRNP
jgi:hypothetical protein